MAKSIAPIEIHQLLVWKYPRAANITDACRAAAREYGLTTESMRTYAYSGIGYRSKCYGKIAADIADMKRYEESGWRLIAESEKRLAEALDFHARTLRNVADQFYTMKQDIQQRIKERENA